MSSSEFLEIKSRIEAVETGNKRLKAQCKRLRKKFDSISAKLRSTDSKLLRWSLCRKYRDYANLVDGIKESNDALKTSIEASQLELLERATQLESDTIDIKRLKKLFNSGKFSIKRA